MSNLHVNLFYSDRWLVWTPNKFDSYLRAPEMERQLAVPPGIFVRLNCAIPHNTIDKSNFFASNAGRYSIFSRMVV